VVKSNGEHGGGDTANVLVIFGISGDLARVMTFRSLYRLEARGLLDCPIVGVAFDDWGPKAANDLVREYGGWHGPWLPE
jgi:glucose-6-phosphate 1-dehydrogenase